MSDTFASFAERDQYFDSLVDGERLLFERRMDELRRAYAEIIRDLDERRRLAVVHGSTSDDIEDIEGDEMQDDEEAGVL